MDSGTRSLVRNPRASRAFRENPCSVYSIGRSAVIGKSEGTFVMRQAALAGKWAPVLSSSIGNVSPKVLANSRVAAAASCEMP